MKKLRNVGVVGFLAVSALALSGCWAVIVDNGGGSRNITIPSNISDQIIWNCTAKKGTGAPRAFCALDTVHALCTAFPEKGISEGDCNHISSYGDWGDMEDSIVAVTGSFDCLSFFWRDGTYPGDFWEGIPKGHRGCT